MYNVKGKKGKNDVLEQHAPLVRKLAHQLKAKLPPSVEVDDLIQAGMMGLLDAVNRYEETHGAQFETYAVQRIRGAMLDELRSSDWLPRSIRQNARKVEEAMQTLLQQLGRQPQEAEVAQHMKISLSDYQALLTDCGGHQLIYYEDFHDDEGGHEHFLDRYQTGEGEDDPLQTLINGGFREAVVDSIKALPEREQLLMALYYEQEMNLKEIGAVMGVSESRVCQLHSQAISRMRSYLREHSWSGVA
ncbi:flagellar operon RNA polymerase sigma factor [Herbaspirillum sp. GW103]|jgi:RNA polymerase sigma factor for flagellar operon FliA|uniref:RNA polymerase sigma factor FliA n=1 Tax=unclassified Herbaspirillum TaxID=2624150 RepID=UPI00025E40D5|nr:MULTISPECIES: RNA polymerase sigma factor FliA [unclassified Herbaspirillum]EIJ47216.1 flagellar operon RNA polymerase sigma factor [Herbaspirillum sp. GW103]MCI1004780.1 RNA polymerase sigma factor FliA [Herbaspirillum sp. C7C8]